MNADQVPQSINSPSVPLCALCRTPMQPLMQMPINIGGGARMTDGTILMLDTYRCPNCRRIDFFDLDLSLPKR